MRKSKENPTTAIGLILTGIKNKANPSPSEMERTTVFLLQENISTFFQNQKIESCWLKSFDTSKLEPTNQNSIKVPKDFEPTNNITKL